MSLGLKTAGFEISAHIESDPSAAASHAANFSTASLESEEAWSQPRDMNSCSPETVLRDFRIDGRASEAFDVLAAGLPCQAFARIGRSKLRSVSGDDDAFRKDPRASLYRRFLEYVQETQPLAILIENVPDILNFGGHNIPEEICATLEDLGYRTRYTILNAAFYGVPQLRERLFLVALDASLDASPDFPVPSHCVELPRGYEGSRCVALKHVPRGTPYFHPIPEPENGLPKALVVKDALADLPFISQHFTNPSVMRQRRVEDRLPYRINKDLSEYALAMRRWPGFETDGEVGGNVVRLTARDFPIFQRMPHGADYPKALKVAEEIFEEKLAALAAEGYRPRKNSLRYAELRSTIIPPYDPGKFPNKWWKLDPSAPSRTLTAHIGKDTYSHIHYDGRQKRTISVREAARLQSFPDGFRLAGSMNAAFRQVGNAVPPLLALAVARTLRRALLKSALAVSDPQHRFAA
jgi:DNA (cytosine-5)-methyltransferase 1